MKTQSNQLIAGCGDRFYRWVAYVFDDRNYARNNRKGDLFSGFVLYALFLVSGVLAFDYFPFRYWGILWLLGSLLGVFVNLIHDANKSPCLACLFLVIGALGWYAHCSIGLVFLGYHFDFVWWATLLIAGGLSILRRGWNQLMWRWIDRGMALEAEELKKTEKVQGEDRC